MPTIQQLVRSARQKMTNKSPALKSCPQRRGFVCNGLHKPKETELSFAACVTICQLFIFQEYYNLQEHWFS
jgi:ribosomal protein S12